MKKVNLSEIKIIFDKLLEQKISRESASSWALELQVAEDSQELVYEPAEDEKSIWKAIDFLVGVDLKCSPNEYLHSKKDIFEFRNEL